MPTCFPVLSESNATAHVYYAAQSRLDAIHAERLGALPQVTLHPVEYRQHDIRALRDSGWLREFLARLAAGPVPRGSHELDPSLVD